MMRERWPSMMRIVVARNNEWAAFISREGDGPRRSNDGGMVVTSVILLQSCPSLAISGVGSSEGWHRRRQW